ncbi:MAG: hypothetical protein V4505_06170 [Pseudomonadota bacterium]
MKKIVWTLLACLALCSSAYARGQGGVGRSSVGHTSHGGGSHMVRGHTRRDGVHVAPHRARNASGVARKPVHRHRGPVLRKPRLR